MRKHDWDVIGARDAYFGVLTDPRFHGETITQDAIADFYKSGHEEIARILKMRSDFLNDNPKSDVGLDIGCGVGRLTEAMSAHCNHVIGYDISQPMLDKARRHADENNLNNIEYRNKLPTGPVDWINSFIVFQHIPPKQGLALLEDALALCANGCLLTLHFTLWREDRHSVSKNIVIGLNQMRERAKARKSANAVMPLIRMYDYDLNVIVRVLTNHGAHRLCLHKTNHDGHHGVFIVAITEK